MKAVVAKVLETGSQPEYAMHAQHCVVSELQKHRACLSLHEIVPCKKPLLEWTRNKARDRRASLTLLSEVCK